MGLFKKRVRKTKNRFGKSSNVSKLSSPYRKSASSPPPKKRIKTKSYASAIPHARLRKSTDKQKWKTVLSAILSIGLIGFGVYSIFFSNYFIVDNFQIEEEGTIIDDYQSMSNILQKIIDQNLIFVNEEKLIREIRNIHPEIDKIKIKKIFPGTIKIEYDKFPTAANIVNIVDGIQKRFLADNQGFLIEENVDQLDLPHIYIDTANPMEVRHTIVNNAKRSKEKLTYIINSINLFEEKFGIKILYADFKVREREVHLNTEKRFYVMIDMEKDLITQIEKLKKSLSKLDIYNVPLVYIDLRISGKDTEKVIFKRI